MHNTTHETIIERTTYPHALWVVVVKEYPLTSGTIDPDRSVEPAHVDIVAFPARGTADTASARRFVSDNTYVDLGRKVFRCCDMRMTEVRR